jgi:putative glutathione S-transferase
MPTTRPSGSIPSALLTELRIDPAGTERAPAQPHRFRARIGSSRAGGYYAAPHRFQLYLRLGCPHSLRVSITLDLLGLRDAVPAVALAPHADAPAALRTAYRSTEHHYDGPFTVPALCDRWSGRVVSNRAADILDDLADRLAPAEAPPLRPAGWVQDIETVRLLVDEGVTEAAQRAGAAPASARRGEALHTLLTALDLLDQRLAATPYVLGGCLTAADVDLWTALVQLDAVHRLHLDADTVELLAGHRHLWSYVRRLHELPAFHRNFRAEETARLHARTCRGPGCSGAAVRLPGILPAGAPAAPGCQAV